MDSLPPDLDPPVDQETTPHPSELAKPASLQPRQCEPLELSFCSHMPYNSTSYPNVLGHVDLREINEHLISFRWAARLLLLLSGRSRPIDRQTE